MNHWITTTEAIALSKYNVQHIRRLLRDQRSETQKKGGRFWINRVSLLRFIAEGAKSGDPRRGAKSR